jgi:hypothetical protein
VPIDKAAHEALLQRVAGALTTDGSSLVANNATTKLDMVAAHLLLQWIVGAARFDSQSQQTEYWLSTLYDEIFTDEQPDATRIYERFGFSLPRANYLARLLRARRAAQWRLAARVELKAQLERRRKDAEQAQEAKQAHIQEFDISLSAGAADELRVIYDRIAQFAAEHERPKPPKARPSFGNSRWLGIPAETLLLILKQLDAGGQA